MLDQNELVNTIKLLIYKENPTILERVDFDDDNVFLEPLLFCYFNLKNEFSISNEVLSQVMQGHFIEKVELKTENLNNNQDIVYVPQLGYFKKGSSEPFEPVMIIENTSIELLQHPVALLDLFLKKVALLPGEEIIVNNEICQKNTKALTLAFSLIKQNAYDHFKMIEQCCKKVLLFSTRPENTNSFASKKAHGVAFLNVYQDDYDEVFFVDDIAHQTGHIILTTIMQDRKSFFKIDEDQRVETIIGKEDHRNVYILFHALYTYYTTMLCLDNCIKNDVFKDKQKHEAFGRIAFYLIKCTLDLERFQDVIDSYRGLDNVLHDPGIEIYNRINEKYLEVLGQYERILKKSKLDNQPYNFTYSKFSEQNPFENFQEEDKLGNYDFLIRKITEL